MLFVRNRDTGSYEFFNRESTDLQIDCQALNDDQSTNLLRCRPAHIELVLRICQQVKVDVVELVQRLNNTVHVHRFRPEAFIVIELTTTKPFRQTVTTNAFRT